MIPARRQAARCSRSPPRPSAGYLGPPRRHPIAAAPASGRRAGPGADPVGTALGLAWTPRAARCWRSSPSGCRAGRPDPDRAARRRDEGVRAGGALLRPRPGGQLGLPETFFGEREIHIHVPAGAVPKDGPSAGVTMACALVSLLTGHPGARHGGHDRRDHPAGRVLPVGRLKEKLLAALRAGIQTVLCRADNRPDLEETLPGACCADLNSCWSGPWTMCCARRWSALRKKPAPSPGPSRGRRKPQPMAQVDFSRREITIKLVYLRPGPVGQDDQLAEAPRPAARRHRSGAAC